MKNTTKRTRIKLSLILIILLVSAKINIVVGQNYTELLGRPTNSAITMSILFDQSADVYWEYGTTSGNYSLNTSTYIVPKDTATEIDFTNLQSNTKYYYRTRYRVNGTTTAFSTGNEHTFQTARLVGSTFSFAIEADPHLDTNSNPASFTLTLQNILSKSPDFLLDLGDIFMSEKLPIINQTEVTNRHLLYRPYFNEVCHSVPLYLVLGNHEGELGWMLNGTSNSLPVMAANTRKKYYPNPTPNAFYTGNVTPEAYIGLNENYYAWEWGNAQFIVLDPFWYTVNKPDWGWTLGEDQYNWFQNAISSSHAKFKFVFCHNLIGGKGNDARGGTEYVDFFEMGGQNLDSTWGFNTNRPNWEKPIHQIMVDNNATIFFHGHDHFFGKQDKDGIVYQEVPQPSNRNVTTLSAAQYGYFEGVLLPGRGYILVTVSDTSAKVDYIKTYLPNEVNGTHVNGEIGYSYTISSAPTEIEKNDNPLLFHLEQNSPNPFTNQTTIKYKLATGDNVLLKVFDLFGREITTLVNEHQPEGSYSVNINAHELALKSGLYYYRITVGNYSKNLKMIYIK